VRAFWETSESGSKTEEKTAFAVIFRYLSANNAGAFLPAAVKSVIEGRIGMFEDRLASLLFKQTVEQDMAMNITAASFELDEEYMRRQRGRSIASVK